MGQAVADLVSGYELTEEFTSKYTLKEHLQTLDDILFEADQETGLPVYGLLNIQNLQKGFYDYITPPRQKMEDDWVAMKVPSLMVMRGEDRVDVLDGIAAPNDGTEVDPER